jgi:hypothetical protein
MRLFSLKGRFIGPAAAEPSVCNRPNFDRNQIVNERPVLGSGKGALTGDLWVKAV